jgi:hypothetical protein
LGIALPRLSHTRVGLLLTFNTVSLKGGIPKRVPSRHEYQAP